MLENDVELPVHIEKELELDLLELLPELADDELPQSMEHTGHPQILLGHLQLHPGGGGGNSNAGQEDAELFELLDGLRHSIEH
jgi:hypothetical protein